MTDIVCVGRIDPHNNGDRASLPAGYWEWVRDYPLYDLGQTYPHMVKDKIVIVGGAGLLHPPFKRSLDVIAENAKEVYLWGVGLNTHDEEVDYSPLEWPIVKKAKLVGVRDHIDLNPDVWDPRCTTIGCPSVVHPIFENPPEPTQKIVYYAHKDYTIPRRDGTYPYISNACQIETALNHIAQGQTVITTSYHGALWASWFGREVIVPNAFSTKFFVGLKPGSVKFGNVEPDHKPNTIGRESYETLLRSQLRWIPLLRYHIGGE